MCTELGSSDPKQSSSGSSERRGQQWEEGIPPPRDPSQQSTGEKINQSIKQTKKNNNQNKQTQANLVI